MRRIIIIILAFTLNIDAQEVYDLSKIEVQVSTLANKMHTDTSLANRLSYAKDIEKILSENLSKTGSFLYHFKNTTGISALRSPDDKFKIFTWELFVDKDTYRQFGIIQTSDDKIYVLEDKSDEILRPEFSRLKPEKWYGALYYHIEPFKTTNGETHYLMLGRDSYSYYERRKLVEIFYFDFMGRPRFGNNILKIKDGKGQMRLVNRYLVQYSTTAAVTLRYDKNLDMVVFDHLIAEKPIEKGAPLSYIPDGSFNGLKEQKGKWEFVDMVFEYDSNNILENAVNPFDIMNRNDKKRDADKDIFGREKRKNK